MTNLTKLFCNMLSTGSAINEAEASQIAKHIAYLAHHQLPEGFFVDVDVLEEHIANLQVCRTNAEKLMVANAIKAYSSEE